MADELKSALEIALEKLDQQEEFTVTPLTDEKKKEIAEIRRKYQARIAEAEINSQFKLRQAAGSGALEDVEKIRGQVAGERRRLTERMEKKIEEIRGG